MSLFLEDVNWVRWLADGSSDPLPVNGHRLRFWLLLYSFLFNLLKFLPLLLFPGLHHACRYHSNTEFQNCTACVRRPSLVQAVRACVCGPSSRQTFPALVNCSFSSVYGLSLFILLALIFFPKTLLNFFSR